MEHLLSSRYYFTHSLKTLNVLLFFARGVVLEMVVYPLVVPPLWSRLTRLDGFPLLFVQTFRFPEEEYAD